MSTLYRHRHALCRVFQHGAHHGNRVCQQAASGPRTRWLVVTVMLLGDAHYLPTGMADHNELMLMIGYAGYQAAARACIVRDANLPGVLLGLSDVYELLRMSGGGEWHLPEVRQRGGHCQCGCLCGRWNIDSLVAQLANGGGRHSIANAAATPFSSPVTAPCCTAMPLPAVLSVDGDWLP